jgi:deoxyadenosine/deoxycytidine kinase
MPRDPSFSTGPESGDGQKIYLAVAGNIGAGKSTLTDFLCRTYGVQPFFEPNEDNPYLPDFYADMKRWAFHSQVYFLSHKFRIHQELDQTPGVVVQDRTIFEDAEIFATALNRSGRLDGRDWKTYRELYDTICNSIRPPDLMIYLRCSMKTLKRRIKLRGREMEQNIPTSYLKLLHTLYEDWIGSYDLGEVLVIDTDRLDYLTDLVDRIDVMERIESYLPRGSAHRVQHLRKMA